MAKVTVTGVATRPRAWRVVLFVAGWARLAGGLSPTGQRFLELGGFLLGVVVAGHLFQFVAARRAGG